MTPEFQYGGSVDVRRLRRLARTETVLIGHIGGLMHPAKHGGPGVENSLLARWLHDGTARIVARPYLLQGIRSGIEEIKRALRRHWDLIIREGKDGDLERIGLTAVAAVQSFVRGNFYRGMLPNSAETARRKGSDTPLIDTAFLINSVTWIKGPMKDQKYATASKHTIEAKAA